jgi:hypothetical protein
MAVRYISETTSNADTAALMDQNLLTLGLPFHATIFYQKAILIGKTMITL